MARFGPTGNTDPSRSGAFSSSLRTRSVASCFWCGCGSAKYRPSANSKVLRQCGEAPMRRSFGIVSSRVPVVVRRGHPLLQGPHVEPVATAACGTSSTSRIVAAASTFSSSCLSPVDGSYPASSSTCHATPLSSSKAGPRRRRWPSRPAAAARGRLAGAGPGPGARGRAGVVRARRPSSAPAARWSGSNPKTV